MCPCMIGPRCRCRCSREPKQISNIKNHTLYKIKE
jgi:hypothetical protein